MDVLLLINVIIRAKLAQTGLNVFRKNMRHCCTSVCDLQNCGEDQLKPFPAAGKGIKE
jgi:hypothetical protein